MLNNEQQHAFEYLFGLFDKNGSGSITEADFMKAFEGIKATANAAKATKIDKLVRQWYLSLSATGADTNKDKQISQDEWLTWAAGLADDVQDGDISSKYNHFVNAVFVGITTDDETISAAEYAAWFQSFGLVGDAAATFQKLDAQGDGTINRKEFTELMKAFANGDTTQSGYRLFGDIPVLSNV